ncbi:MAG: phosphoenolpyruvate--protein phosphotransferase [Elusimicrobiota bacterium]
MNINKTSEKITTKREMSFEGTPISKGFAVARVCLFNDTFNRDPSFYKINANDVNAELKRVESAFKQAVRKTKKIKNNAEKNIGKSEAGIFGVHLMMLQDNSLRKKINDAVKNRHLNAEAAMSEVFDEYESRLSSVDDEYIRERGSDIAEIKKRLLGALGETMPTFICQQQDHCVRGQNRILVAEELTPQLTMDMDASKVAGFITERGGSTSHASILARALGIPAVSGIKAIHSILDCGVEVLIDGYGGKVIVNPSEETISKIRESEKGKIKAFKKVKPVKGINVLANINTSADVKEAVEMDAEGIGLYRTEFEFILAGKYLSEQQQYECYSEVLRKMKGKEVYFRILDLGSDKQAPGLKFMREDNPALGLRGARLLEANRDLLRIQARAIARASAEGKARVMVPMITGLGQFMKIKKMFYESIEDMKHVDIKFGAMFEVPSACLEANNILKEADFASIGSNDLIQYLFAVDRNNDSVAYDYDPDRDVFWKLLGKISRAAEKNNKPLSICGEMAAETEYLRNIVKSGINTVSVSSRFIPNVRSSFSALKKK